VWAIGNGLAGTMLILHLAYELNVDRIGLGISLILAAPQLVGVLRLLTPLVSGRLINRKLFCIGTFSIAALLLAFLPIFAKPGLIPSTRVAIILLVSLWGVYHLFQYFGTVAFWTWLSDLVPLRIRGRFIGRRERWLVLGQAIAILVAGVGIHLWRQGHKDQEDWLPCFLLAVGGALFMLLALVPIVRMPHPVPRKKSRQRTLQEIFSPFADRNFLRLLAFGCIFSLANGLTNSANYLFPYTVFKFDPVYILALMLTLRTGMRAGQIGISPTMGRLVDRLGNRRVMLVCGLIVAQGPLFYFVSSIVHPWWFIGAWVIWIAYAGLNVGLPNLMLKLSPQLSPTPYVAAYFTTTGLFLAASTVLGGWLFDTFGQTGFALGSLGTFAYYPTLFFTGWLARMFSVLLLWLIVRETTRS
jgi:MFS family permease